ncbi:type IV secretory pathway TrbL component [Polymorphobacter fuscus]|uniref:Lipoprotein n=1 Tax=Sandarakinorhabdus fusca TaxID=1439888 RepID=A0A7C9KXH3_9SPHN|nr:hypothetical protein [Polymorphobacter fuscus]KAB7647749.1 hypothetical protein F9290_07210 [Polymorphobacter fuscus]MQT17046.1 hypothetical protein [Polymorphobacter fuscus]NJC08962.1 type IV secretory pathway TrbL component [Polymorphobacter fuscus]
MLLRCFCILVLPAALAGCVATAVAGAAVAVVKAPFQVAGAAVDGLTTSQEEADRNAGKKARKEREAAEKAQKKADKAARKAADQDRDPSD